MDDVKIYYLVKSRHVELQFEDGATRTFSPAAMVPARFVPNLLTKQVTIGGCCGDPQRTVNIFATQEQIDSGERKWIEPKK